FPSDLCQKPVDIVDAALREAKSRFMDVLIVDTAGRLHIDADMMEEIKAVHAAAKPAETLFVVEAMTGHDARNTAQAFNEALPLVGAGLSRVHRDARAGAALSVRSITGKPTRFVGSGRTPDAPQRSQPARLAWRTLAMREVRGLIDQTA